MISLRFDKSDNGLIPAIAQDAETGEILMLAYVNDLAFEKTLETGKAHYWSRSRQSLWCKGESSGNIQEIIDILIDCDEDTIIYIVKQIGDAACHLGYRSCFFRKVEGETLSIVGKKLFNPEEVYTNKKF